MRSLIGLTTVMAVALAVLAAAPPPRVAYPDAQLTPGEIRPLTEAQVCSTKWGRDERHVSESLKKQVCLAYGITSGCPGPAYELDHLISRELGGADTTKNLWPQPIGEARLKDRLENRLHVEVCAHRLSLGEAQKVIAADWLAAYRHYFSAPPQKRAQEGDAAACDNYRQGKDKTVDHTCECERAAEKCDPNDPALKSPGAKCKTYCRPDKCDCENQCTS